MCRRSPRFRCLIFQLVFVLPSMAAWADEITLPLPVTRDLALGLPEGSTTSGGADPWTIVPYGEING